MRRVTIDIESNGLLDDTTIDYTASPYKLKDTFKIWCIVCTDIDTNEVFTFALDQVFTDFMVFKNEIGTLIAHNGINFDLLAIKLYLGINYHLPKDLTEKSLWDSREVEIIDTLVLSKTLNPDRFGGHSLDEWGKRLGFHKIDWRSEAIKLGLITYDAPKGAEFMQWHPDMLTYCVRDTEVTAKLYYKLLEEWGTWPFEEAFCLEQKVADIITRQSHRGFDFKKDLAYQAIADLDSKIEDIRLRVEPVLPEKPLTKTKLKDYIAPARQFLKSGKVAGDLVKFIEKHSGTLDEKKRKAVLYGVEYDLPLNREVPLITTEPSTLKDTTHIKEWLVSDFGWEPTQFKDRDLTCDSKKKKVTQDKFVTAVERYVNQTLTSAFCKFRCEHLKVQPNKLLEKLLKHDLSKPLKVLTNPTFTVGQEKEIDPMLEIIHEKFPYVKDITEYLTYNHRRNSILGGGFDPEEDDEDEFEKGFIANVRSDGRIATPADSCGTNTSRFKHKVVCNIPRVTSLYGDIMRNLFGVTKDFIQLGYDFDSLEARIEAHYCWKYDKSSDKSYCLSLIREKPFDVHSLTAKKISEIIQQDFSRGSAKSCKYGMSYGAQAPKVAKIIGSDIKIGELVFNAFWEAAYPLADLKTALTKYWETTGLKQFILGIDKRKIPTRSKHSLVNSLFQSAGVICAKKAMVLHEAYLKEEGLLIDFFTQDYKKLQYCQQLIAYHDESQLELSRCLIKDFKVFKFTKGDEESEKEAKQAAVAYKTQMEQKTCRLFSDVGHMEDYYYVGYARAGELATKAVTEAGKCFNLNIDLTAGYMMGNSWGSCH